MEFSDVAGAVLGLGCVCEKGVVGGVSVGALILWVCL